LRGITTGGADVDGEVDDELADEPDCAPGGVAEPGRDKTAMLNAAPVTATTPNKVQVRFTVEAPLLGSGAVLNDAAQY
jgi:hypothetical protein